MRDEMGFSTQKKEKKADSLVTVIIPAYQPSAVLSDFVDALSRCDDFSKIVIVDDGSGKEYRQVFEATASLPKVVVLHHSVNLGKGRALKTAFNYCLSPEMECEALAGVVTADADGQHGLSDIRNIAGALKRNPDTLILGCRTFSRKSVPFRSWFGNQVSKVVFRWLCGINVADTQTGLRGLPYSFLSTCCRTTGEGYEYETNMLLGAKEQDMPVKEIPIATIYTDGNDSSHFNPLRDSVKIYSVIFKYSLSSMLSVVIDYLIFYLIWSNRPSVMLATYVARTCSALVNFGINRNVVFKYKGKIGSQFLKYIALVFASGTVSAILIHLGRLLPIPITILKAAAELILYFVNFYVQRAYIFVKVSK